LEIKSVLSEPRVYQQRSEHHLILVKTDKNEIKLLKVTKEKIEVEWEKKMPLTNTRGTALELEISAKMNDSYLGILAKNIGKAWYHLYLYNHGE